MYECAKCKECIYLDIYTGLCKITNHYCCKGSCFYGAECSMIDCENWTPPEKAYYIN